MDEPLAAPSTAGAVDLGALKDEKTPEPTPEELDAMMREQAEALGQHEFDNLSGKSSGGTEILAPATVVPKSGQAITSHNLNSIVYSGMGVFIVGTVNNKQKDEVSRLIPWDNVSHVDYDFALMQKLLGEAAEAHAADQKQPDAEPA